MKARKLKLGINMDNGWVYHAYLYRAKGPITLGVMFLSRFSHLCIYLSSMKHFRNTFLPNYESQKAETWYKHGQWVDLKKGLRAHRSRSYLLLIEFFQFIMHFAHYILYLWTYFKETYIILALQVKEDVVQKGPTAHISWSYITWYVFQLMYFAISEKFS